MIFCFPAKLKEQNENKQYITEIKNSLQLILKQNYFEFNSKIYQQQEDLAMGSPLSSIIAEISRQHIDTKIQNIIKTNDPDGISIRYVDAVSYTHLDVYKRQV